MQPPFPMDFLSRVARLSNASDPMVLGSRVPSRGEVDRGRNEVELAHSLRATTSNIRASLGRCVPCGLSDLHHGSCLFRPALPPRTGAVVAESMSWAESQSGYRRPPAGTASALTSSTDERCDIGRAVRIPHVYSAWHWDRLGNGCRLQQADRAVN